MDGVEDNSTDLTFGDQGTLGSISIGGHASLDLNFAGTIDEVAIRNRTLGPEEISDLYRLRNGTYFWKVNVTDTSSNRNNNESETREFVIGLEAPADSCTYGGSGDFVPLCSDNCVITSDIDLDGNDLIIQGKIGVFVVRAAINNIDRLIKGFNSTATGLDDQCYIDVVSADGGVLR